MPKKYDTILETPTFDLTKETIVNASEEVIRVSYWLWDDVKEMNIAMHASSEHDAFTQALEYYQGRCKEMETKYTELYKKALIFVESFNQDED